MISAGNVFYFSFAFISVCLFIDDFVREPFLNFYRLIDRWTAFLKYIYHNITPVCRFGEQYYCCQLITVSRSYYTRFFL